MPELFARYSISDIIFSYNVTQFTDKEFESVFKTFALQHIKTHHHHSRLNVQTERFVDTLKSGELKTNGCETKDLVLQ